MVSRQTESTLSIALENRTSSSNVFAYITGRAIDHDNALFLLQADGRTPYYPTSPSQTLSPLAVDCAIPLGSPGSSVNVTVPHLAGARLWFVRDARLSFFLNPGPALVEPSVMNPSDPNIELDWTFCEFTFNSAQLYANISYVDFVAALPVALTLTNAAGESRHVAGLPADGLDRVCAALREQHNRDPGVGWDRLIVTRSGGGGGGGGNLRAVSPNTARAQDPALFNGFYQPYVDEVWAKYTKTPLTVNTQASWGDVQARAASGLLDFGNGIGTYSKPAAADIFSCSTGPFTPSGNPARDAVSARLAAAFNRSTLHKNSVQPNNEEVGSYYQHRITNHYARIVHELNIDHRGYAFPYDDVGPESAGDQSGSVFDPNPRLLTVTVGGGQARSAETPQAPLGIDTSSRRRPWLARLRKYL